MTIKSFYTLLLSATTLILASCSTEVTDEQSAVAGSATRSFTVREVQAPMTRTNVSLTKPITWNKGDRLIATTSPLHRRVTIICLLQRADFFPSL